MYFVLPAILITLPLWALEAQRDRQPSLQSQTWGREWDPWAPTFSCFRNQLHLFPSPPAGRWVETSLLCCNRVVLTVRGSQTLAGKRRPTLAHTQYPRATVILTTMNACASRALWWTREIRMCSKLRVFILKRNPVQMTFLILLSAPFFFYLGGELDMGHTSLCWQSVMFTRNFVTTPQHCPPTPFSPW